MAPTGSRIRKARSLPAKESVPQKGMAFDSPDFHRDACSRDYFSSFAPNLEMPMTRAQLVRAVGGWSPSGRELSLISRRRDLT